MSDLTPDICVIGAGAAGLSVAAGAAQMGARTVLIERDRMGGECLNTGCVPSKALLAAAKAARAARSAPRFGVAVGPVTVDWAGVRRHLAGVIASIAPHDSVERFEGLGVTVLRGAARFTGPDALTVDGRVIRARRFVIATGSKPAIPPIAGLDAVPHLTNESIFDLDRIPQRLIIVGGGAIGVELGQAFKLLGAEVAIVEAASLLAREDPELVAVLRHRLRADGIRLHEEAKVERVDTLPTGVGLRLADGSRLEGSHLLIATGRRPAIEGLGLEAAGVARGPAGIVTDRRLRTSNRRISALGDVIDGPRLTTAATHQAGVVIRNLLFRLPAKVDYRALPRAVFGDPELASVGADGRAAGPGTKILRARYATNDRARAEGETEGLLKLLVGRGGRVVGCGIVGAHAGDLIQPFALAIAQGLKVGALASMIAPYPTLSELGKAAAGSYFTPTLFSARARWVVRLLARLG